MTKEEKKLIYSIIDSSAYYAQMKAMVKAIPETCDQSGTWQRVSVFDTLDKAGNFFQLTRAKCSSCNAIVTFVDYNNYCPRCGSNNTFKE